MTPRERLLEGAIEVLRREGYARTTTRQIVAEAGLHLPAVNYYFGSKERLLHDAIVEALRRWGETTMKVVDAAHGGPHERLRGGLERFLWTLGEARPYVVAAVEAFAQAERSEELRGRLAEAYREFREVVAESVHRALGAEPDDLPQERVLAFASTMIALCDGLAIQWLIEPTATPDAGEVIESLGALAVVAGAPASP